MSIDPKVEARKAKADSGIGALETNGQSLVNYRQLAPVYLRQGYSAPIPLPQGQKSPPPSGFTGRGAKPPPPEQIRKWCEERGNDGIAFVLQDGQVVIDVDNYAKGKWPAGTGVATMAVDQDLAGCVLPPGPKLRNRTDGSEKRPFRVPPGLKFKKSLGPCVDVVTPTHRYVNAGVNPETGSPEQWFDADDNLLSRPPAPDTWPELPEAWVLLLIQGFSEEPPPLATDEQAQAWLDSMPDGPIGSMVQEQLDHALAGLAGRCLNPEHGARHDCLQEHVRWLVEMGAAGLTGVPAALKFLRKQFIDAVKGDRPGGEREAAYEFDGYPSAFVQWGARVCRPDTFFAIRALDSNGGELKVNLLDAEAASGYKVFKVMGPTEWAKSVPDPEFLIEKVLCQDTSGVSAGPKKSLKTHDNQAIALAVATGMNLYRSEHFPVRHQGKVLYVVGEGGEIPTRRTLRRMARAYGLDLNVIAQDPAFPLVAAFGAAPLDSPQFCGDLKRMLDEHQPDLVLIESFYNFHPADVNAANLFERGPVIDAYHKLVVSECEGATSMMTDHFRSTNRSKTFDLDSISMAGQAENADSWILRDHREKPNVSEGEFWLKVVFASRQWGDSEWEIDWHVGPFDHNLGHHVGGIAWDVRPAMAAPAEGKDAKTAEHIWQVVMDNPFELTETGVLDKVGGKREKAYEVFQGLKVNGWVVVQNRERKEGARMVKRDLVGLGN